MLIYREPIISGGDSSDQTIINMLNDVIYFYINNIEVNNRYFQYNGLLSNINPCIINNLCYLDEIIFYTSEVFTDATIYLYNDNLKIYEFIITNNNYKIISNINLLLNENTKLKIFITSSGCNYPMLKIKLKQNI